MTESKIGVLLLNLGTPDSPKTCDVRRYLNEFLSDPRVIDLPWIVRKILLHIFILPFRSAKSAKAYKMIWENKGSPLLFHTKDLQEKVQAYLGQQYCIEVGMRYGNPSISAAVNNLLKNSCQKIIVLPLFPQYSSAATGSAIEATLRLLHSTWQIPSIVVNTQFYSNASYIEAQSEIIKPFLNSNPEEGVLFSYHSLPVRHIKKSQSKCQQSCDNQPCVNVSTTSCYRAQCYKTSYLLAQKLGLEPSKYRVAFQSRLGRTKWIGPDIESTMKELIENNICNLVVICPSFVADCLETLEEIGIRASESWKKLGGKTFTLVPSLNSEPIWVKTVSRFIQAPQVLDQQIE